jgi:hypothetical protein
MHAVHVGAKIVHIDVQLFELLLVLPKIPLKRRAELHIDIKNKTKCTVMTYAEMIQFSATCGRWHL